MFSMFVLLLAVLIQTNAAPLSIFRRLHGTGDGLWPWNGWLALGTDTLVSIVDRSPALTFNSRAAAFGSEISDPLLGYVIPLSSFTTKCENASISGSTGNVGCPTLCVTGPHEPESTETWIALVQRGQCQFADKVREAQRLGAKAVVVGGDDPAVSGIPDNLISMYSPGDASDISIASTFIRYSDYEELSSIIAVSNTSHSGLRTVSLLLTKDNSDWRTYSPIITFALLLLLPSLLTLFTLLVHRIRARQAAIRDRAPPEVVISLPWQIWTGKGWEKHTGPVKTPVTIPSTPLEQQSLAESGESPSAAGAAAEFTNRLWFDAQVECAICLSDFVKGDRVRVLPCHHIFHVDEIDEWLIHRKKLCPVCKADVTQPRGTDTVEPSETTPLLHSSSS